MKSFDENVKLSKQKYYFYGKVPLPKEYYSVNYKTYNNARLKKVVFQGSETYPLYLQVTYDRKSIFFKSYYFELFSRPKYALLPINILQVIDLESRLLDALIDEDAERFTLDGLLRKYKLWSVDVLDSCEGSFKELLAEILRGEGLEGLAGMVRDAGESVAGILLWRDLEMSMMSEIFERMKKRIIEEGHPYLPLASYVSETSPGGPVCLPLGEWRAQEREIERFLRIGRRFRGLDMGKFFEGVRRLLEDVNREAGKRRRV